jgi:hypothetical protein
LSKLLNKISSLSLEPVTFLLVASYLNHCDTACPLVCNRNDPNAIYKKEVLYFVMYYGELEYVQGE